MFWVYILLNPPGRFYIGQTDDLKIRLANHNRTDKVSGKFTLKNGPWQLVWSDGSRKTNQSMEIRQDDPRQFSRAQRVARLR